MTDSHKVRVWNQSGGYYLDDFYLTPAGEVCEFGVFNGESKIRKFENQENFIKERCTGLLDRDGYLIYDGDVVKCDIDFVPDGRVGLTRTVIFKDGAFQLSSTDGGFYFIMGFHNIEIIGNIHDGVME